MNAFTIKDLENLSGIKAHTIRIWEQRYSFLAPQRTKTNIRSYSNNELKTILNVALLAKNGYKISHINRMNPGEMNERILSLSQAEAQQERLINELIHTMINLEMDKFEVILDNYIVVKGVEKAILQIIFPFLERIGILWLTNHINPAQEHFATNIIRQKLIMGIENVKTTITRNKSVLLFLPEGEHHELGLLFTSYILKSRAIKVYYLGANVPLKDVEFVAKLKQPDVLYTHLTSVAHNFNFEKFLDNVHSKIPGFPLTISGILTRSNIKKIPPNIRFIKSLQELTEYVAAI